MRLALTFLALAFSLSACATATSTQPAVTLQLNDCVLARGLKAQCGTLDVPEDRAAPDGRRLALNVAVVPAVSRNPSADPLFLLAGGPGQAAIEAFPAAFFAFEAINQDRAIVLVDQRGTGESNPLRCFAPDDERLLDEAAAIAELKQCPAKLNADLRHYTTEIAMQDLDAVRAALGYEQINLYGASYGTRAALAYLRLYPERVRSVILDAVVSADFMLFLSASQDGQRALDLLFARCDAEADCHTAFPNLRAEFAEVLQRLDAESPAITLPDPVTGEPVSFTLTRRMFTSTIFSSLYSPEFVALLPLGIHTAFAQNDFAPLLTQAISLDAGLYDGMFYAVACAEDAPFLVDVAASATNETFGDQTTALREVCASWPQGGVTDAFRQPVRSDVPVLLLSGEADPITPPQYANEVASTLPNSLHLIAPGMGHGIFIRGCVDRIARDFIASGSVKELDTVCVQNIEPPPFFVSFTGPRP
ncbi:MAG: alpha/beta hydrolase [Anaerolineales bacterium]